MKNKKSHKQNNSKRIFKTIQDILQFEDEMYLDSLSKEERKLELSIRSSNEIDPRYEKYHDKNKKQYYCPETDGLLFLKDDEIEDYSKNNTLIPMEKFFSHSADNNLLSQNPLFVCTSEPIIFESKGKTPPSVRYLQTFIVSDLGDEDLLYDVHQKTFA